MNEPSPTSDYLVLSRGQWDKNASEKDIEGAIQKFYDWYARNLDAGRMKAGSRLSVDRAVVSKAGIVTDGPFGEARKLSGLLVYRGAQPFMKPPRSPRKTPVLDTGLLLRFVHSNRRARLFTRSPTKTPLHSRDSLTIAHATHLTPLSFRDFAALLVRFYRFA
jgi:hypothetical protein